MRLHRRPELRHSSGRRYLDTFAAVSPRWTLRAGTLAAGLQAATAGDWLGNNITNPEFTVDTSDWVGNSATLARVDSTIDPGAVSGGLDAWCVKVTLTGNGGRGWSLVGGVAGMTYGASARAYAPSSDVGVNAACLVIAGIVAGTSVIAAATGEDAWETLSGSFLATITAAGNLRLCPGNTGATLSGDVAYFDMVAMYRQNTVATLSGWGSPNITATLNLPMPAAPSVVPFSFITRYTDTLNYWEVRVTPNTAGTDLEIIEVVAGVPTVRATADIDWTASQTDQMRVTVRGTSIAVEAKKFGAGAFTAAASFSPMATGLTATNHGMAFFGTGVNRITRWESVG